MRQKTETCLQSDLKKSTEDWRQISVPHPESIGVSKGNWDLAFHDRPVVEVRPAWRVQIRRFVRGTVLRGQSQAAPAKLFRSMCRRSVTSDLSPTSLP